MSLKQGKRTYAKILRVLFFFKTSKTENNQTKVSSVKNIKEA